VTEDLHIRRHEPGDHDAVWRLHNEALWPTGAHPGNGPWDDDLHHVDTVYLDAGGEFVVGELKGEIVAMGGLRRTGPEDGEITRMRVKPEYQRRGLGKAILEALEIRARELGIRVLHLETTVIQQQAQRFYEQHGYQPVTRRRVAGFECLVYMKRVA